MTEDTPDHHQTTHWTTFGQFLAFYAAAFILVYGITTPFLRPITDVSQSYAVATPNTMGGFLVMFSVATIVAIVLIKYISDKRFWSFFFGVAAFAGVFLTLFYPLVLVLPEVAATVIASVLTGGVLVARAKKKTIWLHNLVILLASVGVARIFAVHFTPQKTLAILGILAAYDIIAVYFSKHMIQMAVTLFSRDAFFGVIIPREVRGWRGSRAEVTLQGTITVLGGGDIAFPLFFAVTMLIHFGHLAFVITTLCIAVGIFVMHLLYTYPVTKRPIPGLPPLVLSCVGAHYLVIWLVTIGIMH